MEYIFHNAYATLELAVLYSDFLQRYRILSIKLFKSQSFFLNRLILSFKRGLVLCVCFVDRCLSFCPFSFGHCVVCSSTIYEF